MIVPPLTVSRKISACLGGMNSNAVPSTVNLIGSFLRVPVVNAIEEAMTAEYMATYVTRQILSVARTRLSHRVARMPLTLLAKTHAHLRPRNRRNFAVPGPGSRGQPPRWTTASQAH